MVVEDISFLFKTYTSSLLTRRDGIIGVFLLLKNFFMINEYVFGTVLGLSNFALILAIYLSFDPLISEVYSFDWISKASLLLAVGFMWYFLVNLDGFFKDSVIDLLTYSKVLQSNFLILRGMKLQNIFNVSDKTLHCSLQFWFWKALNFLEKLCSVSF